MVEVDLEQKTLEVISKIEYHQQELNKLQGILDAFDLISNDWKNSEAGRKAKALLSGQNRLIPTAPKVQPTGPGRIPGSGRKPMEFSNLKKYNTELSSAESVWVALYQLKSASVPQLVDKIKELDKSRFKSKTARKLVENALLRFKKKELLVAKKDPQNPKQYIYSIK